MNRLRRQVEFVVRPLCATELRKNRIREELLRHLTDLYERQFSQTGDEDQAITRALAQFGAPDELRRELQDSVPWIERILWMDLPFTNRAKRRPGESAGQHHWRVTRQLVVLFTIYNLVMVVAGIGIVQASGNSPARKTELLGPLLLYLAGLTLVFAVFMCLFPLACDQLRHQFTRWQTETGRLRRKAALALVTWMLLVATLAGGSTAIGLGLLPAYLGIPMAQEPYRWLLAATAAILIMPLAILQAWTQAQRERQFAAWDGTEVESLH